MAHGGSPGVERAVSRRGRPIASALAAVSAGWVYYQSGLPEYTKPAVQGSRAERAPRLGASGPLRAHSANPRYFADGGGRAVVLAGSHTWSNLHDNGFGDPPPPFDCDGYLDFLVAQGHNFMRLWVWEQSRWGPWVSSDDYYCSPGPPYRRAGPDLALDGKPRFNLDLLDQANFDRLRDHVARASEHGTNVAVMLFNGWSIDNRDSNLRRGNPWHGHPFNLGNNVNGVDGDPNSNDGGEETHQLSIPRITAYQEAYVRRVIDTVDEFDNGVYEVSNESYASSRDWQYHLIAFIHDYEKRKPKRHPVGMTQYQWPGDNHELLRSPADWISPWEELPEFRYRDDPTAADRRKVVIVDTDHLWGIGGDRKWAWKSFLRGNNVSFMDGYDGAAVGAGAPAQWDVRLAGWKDIARDLLHRSPRPMGWRPDAEQWVSLRANIGYILAFAKKVDMSGMRPRPDLASTRYCLAREGGGAAEYLVYSEGARDPVDVDLSGCTGVLQQEWFDPQSGKTRVGPAVRGGKKRSFNSPWGNDGVLYLHGSMGGEARVEPARRPAEGAGR